MCCPLSTFLFSSVIAQQYWNDDWDDDYYAADPQDAYWTRDLYSKSSVVDIISAKLNI